MIKRLWSYLFILILLTSCGYNGTPTRQNDITPLTSIQIIPEVSAIAASKTIAMHTSTKLTVMGNFSNLFTRDITDQVVWSSGSPAVAEFITASQAGRVTGHIAGTAVLTATVKGITSIFTLIVSPATISTLTITPLTPSIPKGLSQQFTAVGTFSDATTQDLTFDASWTSATQATATIGDAPGNKGLAQALAMGTSIITAGFDGKTPTTVMTVTEPVLQSITIVPASPSIPSISSGTFTATGNYSNNTTVDLTSLATWASSNTGIATITAPGSVATQAQGTTAISAELNGVSGSSTLKVTGGNLTAISIAPLTPKLVLGTVTAITATGTFSNGTTRDITSAVTWTTADGGLATVTTPTLRDSTAWLNAVAATNGTVITAAYGSISATTSLSVVAPQLNSTYPLSISPAGLNLTTGASDQLTVSASYNDGTTQDVTANADWASSNSAIVTVDNTGLAKGKVTGVAAGTANITANFGGRSIQISVPVTARTLKSLTISGVTAMTTGNQGKFIATATYYDGATHDVTNKTNWSISNQNIAILPDSTNQPGQLVAVDGGSATLTAVFGGLSQTATITVTTP